MFTAAVTHRFTRRHGRRRGLLFEELSTKLSKETAPLSTHRNKTNDDEDVLLINMNSLLLLYSSLPALHEIYY